MFERVPAVACRLFPSCAGFLLAVSLLAPARAQDVREPKGSISGVVRDCRGEPLAAARVWCVRWPQVNRPLAEGLTDGEGFFVLARVPPAARSVRVLATARGCSQESDYATVSTSSLRDHVRIQLWDADEIRGRVVDTAGEPQGGITATASNEGARVFAFDPLGAGVTDENGRFALPRIPLGEITVRAWAPQHVVAQTEFWHAGERDGVQLTLRRGAGVTLSVQVEGLPRGTTASIRVLSYSRGSFQVLPAPTRGATDAGGHWEVAGLPDWEYRVSASAAGHSFSPREVRAEPGEARHEMRFVAVRDEANVLRGTLKDGQGRPLPDQRLVCRASNGGRRSEATTAADGSFSLESPLAPGTKAVLYLVGSRFVTAQAKPVPGFSFDARDLNWHEFVIDPEAPVEVVAQPAAVVAGQLLDSAGQPIAFQRVTLQEASARRTPRWMSFAFQTTDRDGRFRFGNIRPPDNPIRVACGSESAAQATDAFRLGDGEERAGVELVVARPGATSVFGRVLDQQGCPVAGARVWLRDWDFETGGQASGSVEEVLTGRDGRYRFAAVGPGGHYLQVYLERDREGARSEPFAVDAGASAERDFEVEAPGT